ncbi:putative C2 and GRAM domain-containing protein-like protein [Tanacetum coccineum]
MLQFPTSTKLIPTSLLLPIQWPPSDEFLLANEESQLQDKIDFQLVYGYRTMNHAEVYNEISKINSNLIVIGKTVVENEKEEFDNEADDDDADNAEESEGDEFEQETG